MDDCENMPLKGVRVLELATVVATPAASRMLCAYGAEVVKIETSYGDELRRVGEAELVPYDDFKNPIFTIHNSNKKLTSVNIKSEAGREVVMRLLERSDVFISNVRYASLGRLGLDYEALKERFPRLIYAHFSGYGPKGPAAGNPGFDSTAFWLRSGPMSDWQVKGSYPFVPTYAFGDVATSSVLLSGILMALIGRQATGRGTKVETSLFASGIWCNSEAVVSTQFQRKHLNPDPSRPSNPFDNFYLCGDGRWLGMYTNEYCRDRDKFARVLGMEDIITDPRYASLESIAESGVIAEGVARLAGIMKTKTAPEWREILISNSISCEVMRSICEVSSDEQAVANGYVEKVDFADGLQVMMPCPPVFFSDYSRRPYQPTGALGGDTDSVLEELGYTAEQIAGMRADGAVR
jgi:crotonobetainyl-CoA:carnitine CoA-transferase CaiB-like acyl-CoA transferase